VRDEPSDEITGVHDTHQVPVAQYRHDPGPVQHEVDGTPGGLVRTHGRWCRRHDVGHGRGVLVRITGEAADQIDLVDDTALKCVYSRVTSRRLTCAVPSRHQDGRPTLG